MKDIKIFDAMVTKNGRYNIPKYDHDIILIVASSGIRNDEEKPFHSKGVNYLIDGEVILIAKKINDDRP